MRANRSVKGFMLLAAGSVSTILFVALYFATTHVFDRAVERNAATVSATLAEGTFNAMFQIMRQGWSRTQLEEFIAAVQHSSAETPYTIDIYRGDLVTQLFGTIEQAPLDRMVHDTFVQGRPIEAKQDGAVRHTYPLTARTECLQCHVNVQSGQVLGVIDVQQSIDSLMQDARQNLLLTLLLITPIPLFAAIAVAVIFQRRVDASLKLLQENVDNINSVADLTTIEHSAYDLGFAEFNSILEKVDTLGQKLKTVAVDKDLLEFEIRLLEKFVITSEVVRDWREYIGQLLSDINQVIEAYTLFSIFKVDEELFDLEIFWYRPPTEKTRKMMEQAVHAALQTTPSFSSLPSIEMHHHVANPNDPPIELTNIEIDLQTKSLFVETPKIGGIVGIGVHAEIARDETRLLVMESILSTLLNVVGSVKAIYKYTKDLEYYATRDPLTNIYNQRLFWELLNYEVGRAQRHDDNFGLLVIDLDNFKSINDSHGHAFGDRFLQAFAGAIREPLRPGDIFARYGGDEFVVILPEANLPMVREVSEGILARADALLLEAPDGTPVKATASIGVGVFPDHANDARDLFLFADNMMYRAKSHGKNRVGIPTHEDVVEVFRDIGEKSLIVANAIDNKRVIPFYQPIVATGNGELLAVEVLSRIETGNAKLLGAHEFIEIAEKAGLIHRLDFVVMERAFKDIHACGYDGLIFLNLSPRALVLGEFVPNSRHLCAEYGIAPERVVFEITERDTIKNVTLLEQFVNDLKLAGFQLAIDDFGSGFSSFHYLKRFPIDFVKIEGDFVLNMANDPRDAAFVRTMGALTRQLGIASIAEFVETEEVLDQARQAGIDYVQGFHISHPLPRLDGLMETIKSA